MNFPNTFVVIGASRPPEVHLLTAGAVKLFEDRERVSSRLQALEATFGTGIQYAYPAWITECMEQLALTYVGPHQQRMRFICAAIALGEPYGGGASYGSGNDGGEHVKQKPIKPTPRGPAGAAKSIKKNKNYVKKSPTASTKFDKIPATTR